jgi:hypothetical protein
VTPQENETLDISLVQAGDPLVFDVRVFGMRETRHRVALQRTDFARLAPGREETAFMRAVFRFLLDREPQEAILAQFDVAVVAIYFPEFEAEIAEYF